LRVVTVEEMKLLDKEAMETYGLPELILMENAGSRAARLVAEFYDEIKFQGEIAVLAGKGNNGGDAFVVARQLISEGYPVRLFTISNLDYKGSSKANLDILEKQKMRRIPLETASELESYFDSSTDPVMVVDGLIGIGLKGPLSGIFADIVDVVNTKAEYTISLDTPSGVEGDTGQVLNTAIRADITVAMGFPKVGQFIYPGAEICGELHVVDISLPPHMNQEGKKKLLTASDVVPLFKRRDRYAHKNTFGHCLVIGGSDGKSGAAVLASRGCLHSGVGLVTVGSWQESYDLVSSKSPSECMTYRLPEDPESFDLKRLEDFSSVVVGPGLGASENTRRVLQRLVRNYQGPLVIDADGINVLDDSLNEDIVRRKHPTVLTPHPGELARFLGWDRDKVTRAPVAAIEEAVERTHATVILKGATTFIFGPEGMLWISHQPNAGMAKGGSGDVLAGILGGILAQDPNPYDGSRLGVYLHSSAGEFAAEHFGPRSMSAFSLAEYMPNAFKELRRLRESMEAHI
jgi:NAD(P)H-hydrate epimerase